MPTPNIIQIKRRLTGLSGAPSSLSGGELAFNEVDSTLYYGSQTGVIAIAGSGNFVDRTNNQTITGNKSFVNTTTFLSSVNLNSNIIYNLANPVNNQDAATKYFVDSSVLTLSGQLAQAIDTASSTGGSSVSNLRNYVDNNFLNLTGGKINGDLLITGSLSALGAYTLLETNVTTTSAFSITNSGTGPALTVTQTGANDIATFYDDVNTALIIKNDGNVGINTSTPNEKLTVSGNISASGSIFAGNGLTIQSTAGSGSTTLFVGEGKVGINTETPNENLTISGGISATGNISVSAANIGSISINNLGAITNIYSLSGLTNSFLSGFIIDGGSF